MGHAGHFHPGSARILWHAGIWEVCQVGVALAALSLVLQRLCLRLELVGRGTTWMID